ncbi:MAG: efflux RND transporter periplasmic adaptor subunit [Phycisphaerales bacterium]|nr:efflux RND transporter periplasmic adaptor subunit [Phycisphaerales bacterium]
MQEKAAPAEPHIGTWRRFSGLFTKTGNHSLSRTLIVRIFLLGFVGLFILLGAGFVIVGPSGFGISGLVGFEEPAVSVRLMEVVRGTVREKVTAPGEVEPDTKVDISAEVSARIERLPFREGDQVAEGDLVVKLDDRDLLAASNSAKARRDAEFFRLKSEQARLAGPLARLEMARRQLERQASLFESGDISRITLEEAEEAVDDLTAQVAAAQHSISVIESSLEAAEADIARATEALGRTEIRAPMDGVVTALNAEVGELVMVGTMNNAGTVILTVADLSSMHLDARVAESDVARIEQGQDAEIRINAYRDEVFSGDVTRIALQRTLDGSGAGYFKTEVRLELEGRAIYSGLAANVDILVGDHDGLVVPTQSVVDRAVKDLDDEVLESELLDGLSSAVSVIYVVREGLAVCVPVEVGPSSLTDTLVRRGVKEGDQIIIGPYKALEKIRHGDRVEESDRTDGDEAISDGSGSRVEVSF